jgi:hypothetical protein
MVALKGSYSVIVEPDSCIETLAIEASVVAALVVADDEVLVGPSSGFADPGGAGCADVLVEFNQAGGVVVELPIGGGFLHPAEVEFGVDEGLGIGEEKLTVVPGQDQS